MRILFMGTPEFAIPALKSIVEEGHKVVGVVTQPDRPRGRGKQMTPPPIKKWALKKDLNIYQPKTARDESFIEELEALSPDLIVTAAYGHILPKRILDIPSLGCINVHASLLPKYRGAAPIQQAIMDGETETGITIMYMDIGMDTGDIILQEAIPIYPYENAESLHDRLAELSGGTLQKALKLFEKGKPKGMPQDDEMATYCSKIDKSMGQIDWHKDSETIRNHVRGLTPWPGAYTFMDGIRLKIWEVEQFEDTLNKDIPVGKIIHGDEEKGLVISSGDGLVKLARIQAPGKRVMEGKEFLRGNKVEVGSLMD